MVNHAQDLMLVKIFLDLPNKLIPNAYELLFILVEADMIT